MKNGLASLLGFSALFNLSVVATAHAAPSPSCPAAVCSGPDFAGIFQISKVSTAATTRNGTFKNERDGCVAYTDSAGYSHPADTHCRQTVAVFKNNERITFIELPIEASGRSWNIKGAFLKGTVFHSKCPSGALVQGRNSVLATSLCQADLLPESNDGLKHYRFFRNTDDPQTDVDFSSFWSRLFTGGLIPIGFSSASHITENSESLITIEQMDHVAMLVSGRVYARYELVRIATPSIKRMDRRP